MYSGNDFAFDSGSKFQLRINCQPCGGAILRSLSVSAICLHSGFGQNTAEISYRLGLVSSSGCENCWDAEYVSAPRTVVARLQNGHVQADAGISKRHVFTDFA